MPHALPLPSVGDVHEPIAGLDDCGIAVFAGLGLQRERGLQRGARLVGRADLVLELRLESRVVSVTRRHARSASGRVERLQKASLGLQRQREVVPTRRVAWIGRHGAAPRLELP